MFFLLPALIYTFLYIIILEVFFWLQLRLEADFYARYELTILLIFLAITSFFSVYVSRKISERTRITSLLIIFSLSAFLLFYFIDLAAEKQIFLALNGIFFYLFLISVYRLSQYKKDQTARGLVASCLIAGLFFFYTSIDAVYLNFAVPLYLFIIVYAGVTSWMFYQYFSIFAKDRKKLVFFSLIMFLIFSEIAWVASFWPFGYLTTGVIMIMLFYIFWDLIQNYFLGLLSKKRALANLVLFSILIGLILFTARWLPSL